MIIKITHYTLLTCSYWYIQVFITKEKGRFNGTKIFLFVIPQGHCPHSAGMLLNFVVFMVHWNSRRSGLLLKYFLVQFKTHLGSLVLFIQALQLGGIVCTHNTIRVFVYSITYMRCDCLLQNVFIWLLSSESTTISNYQVGSIDSQQSVSQFLLVVSWSCFDFVLKKVIKGYIIYSTSLFGHIYDDVQQNFLSLFYTIIFRK